MFAHHYFAAHYFAPRYWPPKLTAGVQEIPSMSLSCEAMVRLHVLFPPGCAEEIVSILNSGGLLPSAPPFGSAWTQTYTSADHTISAVTTNAITDSSGGTASTTALASQSVATTATDGTTPSAACTKTSIDAILVVIRNSISTLAAELALLKADVLGAKKDLNGLIDDLQAGSLVT